MRLLQKMDKNLERVKASSVLPGSVDEYLDPVSQKALADRLARLEGHLRAVRRMLLEKRCADEILLQVAAVKAALNQFTAVLLEHELQICLQSCMEGSHEERLEKVTRVLATLLKQS